ncbi:MAG: hypothetical protein ACK4NF_04480, partial [Planctomycetota bacterium]
MKVLYKHFLLIPLIIITVTGCSIYRKIFTKQSPQSLPKGPDKSTGIDIRNNNTTKKSDIDIPPQLKLYLDKEKYYLAFNTRRNELLIKYTAKTQSLENVSNTILHFLLPTDATILEAKIYDVFNKLKCAKTENIIQSSHLYVSKNITRKYFLLPIKCPQSPDYLEFDLLYTIPLSAVTLYTIPNKLYSIEISTILLKFITPINKNIIQFYIQPPKNRKILISNNLKRIKDNLFQLEREEKINILIYKAEKLNIQTKNIQIYRLSGRYNLSKIKTSTKFIQKAINFYRIIFDKNISEGINIFLHIEKFSFTFENNIFIGVDIIMDLLSGFMPAKLLRLVLQTFYKCHFPGHIETAILEYLSDYYTSKEYNLDFDVIRYKKLNVISNYFYRSLKDYEYKKELKSQLRIYTYYFDIVKKYKENYLDFVKELKECRLSFTHTNM